MKSAFGILLFIFLFCLVIRNIYELLKKAGKIDLANKILFGAIFADMIIMWIGWFSLCPLDPSTVVFPAPVRWLGLGLFIFGMVLALGALAQLRGVENIKHLVTTGLFAKIRHPMYTGFILWIVGWSVYHEALWCMVAGLAGIASVLFWRWLEDEDLTARYGDTYRAYRAQTWL